MPSFARNQKVYDEGRKPQANGYILHIDWENETILVKFHDTPGVVEYEFDDFHGCWTDKFQGTWWLYNTQN